MVPKKGILLVGVIAVGVLLWCSTAPREELEVTGPLELGPTPRELDHVAKPEDWISASVQRIAHELPGYDDVVVLGDGSALASGVDGWIWRIDLAEGRAERFVDVPLMPAGLRLAPDDPDLVYFCASALYGQSYPPEERVGLYALRVSTQETEPVVLEVPRDTGAPDGPQVFRRDEPALSSGARPLAFCNDLDVSADGRRIYLSEPFAYEGASMGGGAVHEAVALGRHGRLWMYDRSVGTTRLVARGFHFLDGILVEPGPGGSKEVSVLITETTRFRIQRLVVNGPDAGRHAVLWKDLPGMPDGLDRDAAGNVWVGLLTLRSVVSDWIHAHPWIKPLLLRLPPDWIPKSSATGVLALDPRAETALFMALHDGSLIRDVSVAIPHLDRIYLASFDPSQHGLSWMSRPIP